MTEKKEYGLVWGRVSAVGGALDTVSLLQFCIAANNSHVLLGNGFVLRSLAEIDHVVGSDRVPDRKDKD